MGRYRDGYQAGWVSYFENCKHMAKGPFYKFTDEEWRVAERVDSVLSPQQQEDYWLGYYHGRSAAKAYFVRRNGIYTLDTLK